MRSLLSINVPAPFLFGLAFVLELVLVLTTDAAVFLTDQLAAGGSDVGTERIADLRR